MWIDLTEPQLSYLNFLSRHHVVKEEREFISRNQARIRFGRCWIDKFLAEGRIRECKKGNRIFLRMSELTAAAESAALAESLNH
jgi:hypothetical protein